jgi:CarD family transcriptional regulator
LSTPSVPGQIGLECGEEMIRENDVVLYGFDGICHVTGVTTKIVAGLPVEFYVLRPISMEKTTIFVPTANAALVSRMRRLLSLDEVMDLIRSIPDEETIWIEDDLKRRAAYGRIIASGDRQEIVKLIKTLYQRDQELKLGKRKMHSADEKLMKEAEKQLYDEFAHVLKIEPGQVLPFIFDMNGEPAGVQQAKY